MNNKTKKCNFFIILMTWFVLLFSPLGMLELGAAGSDYLEVMKWRNIGPHRGGRVLAVAGHPTQRDVFYFGGTGSGVWKTDNGGETWKNISDGFLNTGSIGAIAVSPSAPNVIYVGTGESCPRGNISHGDGMYKSIDGGKTWKNIGLSDTRHIARIRIHPTDSNTVYVAAPGHMFGPNKERGVFRSLDGGKTWKNILFRSENAGAVDLILEPGNPRVIYAAFWQVRRYPWGFESGGPDSALYKSTDGGNTWTDLSENPGLPKGIKGRMGLAISAAKPNRVWAIIEAEKKGLYRSNNGGDTWEPVTDNADLSQRPWYYHHVEADPVNADTLYVLNVDFWRSTDAGKSWKRIPQQHGDNHGLWIDPNDPLRMICGDDGGASVTFNGGKTWSSIYNQPTSQFYHVTTDNQIPYRVYGAQQDNSTLSVPSRSRWGAIDRRDWYPVGGCESGYIAVHPENTDIVYAGCYGGQINRYDHQTGLARDISVWPDDPMGWGAGDLKYRFQWTFPIVISPHDPNVLYVAGNHLFRSLNMGNGWEVISPDLTRNDADRMGPSGGALTRDNTSVEYYCTIFALAESPLQKGLLWAGTDDGLIHISRDGGENWQNITPKDLPPWALISIIEASSFDAGTAYVAATRYKLDDYRPYLYVTRDFGKTWNKITNGISANDFTRVIREDPNRRGYLYAGTETGVYFSPDNGASWRSLRVNFPVVPVHDMVIRNNDLVVGTHGRSFWILDNLSLLYQAVDLENRRKAKKGKSNKEDVILFEPAQTARYLGGYRKAPVKKGETLPVGVIINYHLEKKPAEGTLELTILDGSGNIVRTFSQQSDSPEGGRKKEWKDFDDDPKAPAKVGMNRFIWDFRYPGAEKVEGAVFWGPDNVYPMAAPGDYVVRLKVGDVTVEKPFEITKDASLPATGEQYTEHFRLMVKIRDQLARTHGAVNEIRGIREQVKWHLERCRDAAYFEDVNKAARALEEKLQPIEDQLIQHKARAGQDLLNYPMRLNNKLTALGGSVLKNMDGAPTPQAVAVYEDLAGQVGRQCARLKQVVDEDVAAFNRLIRELAVPAITLKHMKD